MDGVAERTTASNAREGVVVGSARRTAAPLVSVSQSEPTGPTVHRVLRRYAPRLLARRGPLFDAHQRQVLAKILRCRDPTGGTHAWHCDWCGTTQLLPNNCHNRYCPQCSGPERYRWLLRVSTWRLPVEYLHIVFTLPHEFIPLVRSNQRLLYRLLFQCATATLLSVAREQHGAVPGLAMVLHT